MSSASELSPPSSASSEDESFYSGLLTGPHPPLLPTPACVSFEFSISMLQCDNSYDTPNSLYPSPIYTSEPLTRNQSPDFNSKPILDATSCRRQRKGDPLPQLLHRSRTIPPQPLVETSGTLPFTESQSHGFCSPHTPFIPHTVGTEAVISLAWTGELSFPIVASGRAPSRIGAMLMWPKVKISDAEMAVTRRASWHGPCGGSDRSERTRNNHLEETVARPFRHKRWTLADAIADHGVTNEELVELLEKLRLCFLCSAERSFHSLDPDAQTLVSGSSTKGDPSLLMTDDHFSILAVDESKAWSSARRIFLVCREFILTERNYHLSLQFLVKGESQPAPSSLMLSRLPALIDISGHFLKLMEMNPSVLGICITFLDLYKLLEKIYMQWCEVVGEFFITDKVKVSGPLVKRSNGTPATFNILNEPKRSITLVKRVGTWGKKKYSRCSLDNIASMVIGNVKGKARNKTPIHDLAILPTQRITRYVLLFKDLMINSPLSIRPTTERAAEAAMMLAQKADNAQGHVAFQLQASRA
ncbi:hypothetical protein AGABI2DRAFT_175897 [Agaricus bisporus var. bisporus H97]|uniref:hypothetical protein n=1 Tax=Agaricus bisporus var. bisporus (strain H97 / ATCC MYA-4626 / FGSC 10389) TaxID=936046 RepID=UPI00029F5B59|nr:hypothetical protein AGABI2DRAFT_175897 [Agaricus bisporus var. bisporus H97]EKV51309.1 hypothetical protein AGABI2DRAFT_175897 [Agaricus bisporus var. bisporus H97]